MLSQRSYDVVEALSGQKLRVGRNRSRRHDKEVIVLAGAFYLLIYLLPGRMVYPQQIGDTNLLVAEPEDVLQLRFTDVQTHEQHFLAQYGERHSEVAGDEGLTFSGDGRSSDNDLLMLFKHKLDIGAHAAEDLFHGIVVVLSDNDLTVFERTLRGERHI